MNNNETTHYHKQGRKSIFVFGTILILTGALFVGVNTGLIPYNFNTVILSWQMLLIVIGILNLFWRHIMSGLMLIITGGFFITPRLALVFPDTFYWVGENFVSVYWPVLLISLGVLLILSCIISPWRKKSGCNNHVHTGHKRRKHRGDHVAGAYSRDIVFGSGEHIILDEEFKGGEVNVVFGGVTLDLRKTKLAEGETFLEVDTVFGGVVILVPRGWIVETNMDAIFGGFKDSREEDDNANPDKSRKLIIQGASIFGGVELKS